MSQSDLHKKLKMKVFIIGKTKNSIYKIRIKPKMDKIQKIRKKKSIVYLRQNNDTKEE